MEQKIDDAKGGHELVRLQMEGNEVVSEVKKLGVGHQMKPDEECLWHLYCTLQQIQAEVGQIDRKITEYAEKIVTK